MKISDLPARTQSDDDEWRVLAMRRPVALATPAVVAQLLALLTPEQRLDVFRPWCQECGGPAPCQCWNDE